MATIVTRSGKGSPLTNAEVDGNFTNLNTELGTKANTASLATVATTGAYSDLTGKPTNVSSFTNDSAYITSAALSAYQPLDGDLTAIAALAGTTGFVKKTAANTYTLDTSSYLTGITSGQVTTALGFTPYNSTNPSGFITASALSAYQPLDGDLTAIAALAGTSGIIRKTAADTYSLDTATYLTGITSGQVTTALGFTPYNATNPSGFISSITSANVTTALGFTPYNATNPSGYITTAALASYQPLDGDLTAIAALAGTTGLIRKTAADTYTLDTATYLTGITSGQVTTALGFTPYNSTNPSGYTANTGTVTSVSGTGTVSGLTLTGSVTTTGSLTLGGTLSLTSGNVTTALGYTPYNSTNPSGYITGITSANVTTALGFTPYNATNPAGYITGITSGNVTTALGYTPYNATNPSGYITSSVLSAYLPLSGGTLTGDLGMTKGAPAIVFTSTTSSRAASFGMTDGYNMYLNAPSSGVLFLSEFRSPIMRDTDNSAFFIDAAGTSNLNFLTVGGGSVLRADYTTRFQSSSDFVDGTLVTTDIPATASAGDSFVIEITGKTYDPNNPPVKVVAQGYLYNDTIINYSGISYAGNFSTYIKVFQDGGVLKFWWPRISYWNSFNVNVMGMDGASNGTITRNRVTAIANSTEPTGTKKQQINLTKTLKTGDAAGSISGFNNPTTAPTANTIVYRDSAGDISAREIVLSSGLSAQTPTVLVSMYPTTNQMVRTTPAAVAASMGALTTGNYSSYALPLSGGTLTGALTVPVSAATTGGGINFAGAGSTFIRGTGVDNAVAGGANLQLQSWFGIGFGPSITGQTVPVGENAAWIDCRTGDLTARRIITGLSDVRAPIFYDRDNTAYYVDPNASTSIRTVGDWRADSSAWTGEFSGKIQYHINNWYFQAAGSWEFRRSDAANAFSVTQGGVATALADFRAPVFYDSSNTGFYVDPAGGAYLGGATFTDLVTGRSSPSTDVNTANDTGSMSIRGSTTTVASMSFHRTGAYAINMGLGTDNVFRIGGWSAQSNCLQVFGTGVVQALNDFRAPIFYDSNNTGFYIDPQAGSAFQGALIVGPNTSGKYTRFGGNGGASDIATVSTSNGNLHLDAESGFNIYLAWYNTSTVNVGGSINANGNITAYSDIRIKANVETIPDALDKLDQIRGVTYTRIDLDDKEQRYAGVIAQEIEAVLPEAVRNFGDIKAVDYNATIGLLIQAVKELRDELETLRNRS